MQSRPQSRSLRRKGEGLGRPSPKLVLVFEGLLGLLGPLDEPVFRRCLTAADYDGAVRLWQLSDLVTRIIWDRVYRYSQVYCVVTYLSADDLFARSLAVMLGQAEVPVRTVWAQEPAVFARHLIAMPDVIRVYDPDPGRAGLYSPRTGRVLTDPRQIGIV